MPASPAPSHERITGDDIVQMLLRNLHENVLPTPFRVMVPAIYEVYLNPEDYEPIQSAIPRVADDARRFLEVEIDRLNQSKLGFLARRLPWKKRPIEIIAPAWSVDIMPDPDGQVARSNIVVYSTYSTGDSNGLAGKPTTRVPGDVPPRPNSNSSTRPATTGLLSWSDSEGWKSFPLLEDRVIVGRGTEPAPGRVILAATDLVSRDHLAVRKDPGSGRYLVSDLNSSNGSKLNGKPLAPGKEEFLSEGARIELAEGAVTLRFEIRRP